MWTVYEYRPNDEKVAAILLVAVVSLVVTFSIGYMLGLRNAGTCTGGENLHDNGNAAAGIRNEINDAGSGVSAAVSRIDNAAAAADRVEARISDAAERAEYVKGTADEGRRIIAECQSILRAVRSGGKEKAPQN